MRRIACRYLWPHTLLRALGLVCPPCWRPSPPPRVVHSRDFGTFNDAGDRFIYCRAELGPGLTGPCRAVNDRIAPDRQLHVNTTINAGTSGGIILSVPVLFFMPGAGGQPVLCSPLWRCCACRLCGGICRHLRRNPVSQRQRCYLSYANPACFGCWGLPLSAVWPAPHGGALARKYLCVTRSWIAQRPMFSG